jgi:hypothetical protein
MTTDNGASERQGAERERADRQEIEALLPWHAAGTLRRRDRHRVDEAIKSDPELARHAALVREEMAETIRLNEMLGAPSARATQRLAAAIDAEETGRRGLVSPLVLASRLAGFIAGLSPRTLALATAAAVLAIAIQGFLLLGVITKPHSVYQTAAVEEGGKTRGAFALVRFVHQASAAEITRFLEHYQATLVDGPKAGGLYRVKVAMSALAKEELARIVARMQSEHVIEFVAPSE